jgi:hypothetical protein
MARSIPILKARKWFKHRKIFGAFLNPLNLFCDRCGKHVPSSLPWRCGYCDGENDGAAFATFLNKCRTCKRPPKSLQCPHCAHLLFLDSDRNTSHPARKLAPLPVPPTDGERESERLRIRSTTRLEAKEDLEHELMIARLNEQLHHVRQSIAPKPPEPPEPPPLPPPVPPTPRERLQQSLEEHKLVTVAAHEMADQEYARIDAVHKNNPKLARLLRASIKAWLEDQQR